MEVCTVTGNTPRDYIELRAETVSECAELLRCAQSEFIPHGCVQLLEGFMRGGRTIYLHIFVGPSKPPEIPQSILDAMDKTP